MPWVVRDVVRDINRATGKRWHGLDPWLPVPVDLAPGCAEPLQVTGGNGRPVGFAVCRHQYEPASSLAQTWGTASRFVLTPRLRGRDTLAGLDQLLTQWREHLTRLRETHAGDTAALVTWPSREVSGVRALLWHGLQPMTVLAARPAGRTAPDTRQAAGPEPAAGPEQAAIPAQAAGLVIREAGPGDLEAVTDMEMGVIRYDEQFGGSVPRPATETLVRADARTALAKQPTWSWIAERDGNPVGLLAIQPPSEATWVGNMTCLSPAAYLQTLFVKPEQRGGGVGAALVRHAHAEVDAQGIAVTLLHHSQVNPVSGPFWNRMGYRPLWTSWEMRPAAALR